jgi:cytochrome c peroxidase
MKIKYSLTLILFTALCSAVIESCKKDSFTDPTTLDKNQLTVSLGKRLFFDASLSTPYGLACSNCHASTTGFSDPLHNIVSPGAVNGLFGNRNANAIAYAMYSPPLHYSVADSSYVGGLFWDGRVNTLEEQAEQPFLNPLEMGNKDAAAVIARLQSSPNYRYYEQVYGAVGDVNTAFSNMASAIAAFERSDTLNAFTSKFDYYLKGQVSLTAQELNGMKLFSDTTKAMCSNCHLITPDPASGKILFTDHTYENIGVPKNPDNPYYTIPSNYNPSGAAYVDLGLGDFINNPAFNGTFKVPTLRNVAISAPYFHNGFFTSLEQVVHFYNTRDSVGSGFPAPEYAATIDHTETGNQHLSPQEELDIVAFLKTLTDGYQANNP